MIKEKKGSTETSNNELTITDAIIEYGFEENLQGETPLPTGKKID